MSFQKFVHDMDNFTNFLSPYTVSHFKNDFDVVHFQACVTSTENLDTYVNDVKKLAQFN